MWALGALMLGLLFAPPQDYLADGIKALDDHHPDAAEPLLRKAVDAAPNDFAAHFNLAFALTQQHKDADAIAEYRRSLELKPALYEADLNLGILLLRNKRASEALPPLKEAAEAKPAEARPNLYYAEALLETGDPAGAEQHYASAAAADPKSLPAKQGLARALLRQQKVTEAAAQFRAANDRDGLLEIASIYEKSGRTADAMAIYKEFPEDPAIRARLGQLQVDNRDAAAAIPNLEDAVRKAPTTANRLALADAYRMDKQPEKMLQQLELGAAADPGNFELHMALGRAYRDSRRLTQAAQQFSAAAKIRPDDVAAWNELATASIVGENYGEGLAALDRVRSLGKEVPGDYFLRAITLDKLRKLPEALAAYRQFLGADHGAHPDQEFQARQRASIIERELKK